jgi:hypothetical protein
MIDYDVVITYPLTVTWSNRDDVFIRCTECDWSTPVFVKREPANQTRAVEQGIAHCTAEHVKSDFVKVEVFPVP